MSHEKTEEGAGVKNRALRWMGGIGVGFFAVVAVVSLGFADTIYFKDGVQIDGIVVEENDVEVMLEIPGGTLTYARVEIERIERNEAMFETVEVLGGERYHPRGRELGLVPAYEIKTKADLSVALRDEFQDARSNFSWARFRYAPILMVVVGILAMAVGVQAKTGGLALFGSWGILLLVVRGLLGSAHLPQEVERPQLFYCAGMMVLYCFLMKGLPWAKRLFLYISFLRVLGGLIVVVAVAWMGAGPVLLWLDPVLPGLLNKVVFFLFALYSVPFFFYLARSDVRKPSKPSEISYSDVPTQQSSFQPSFPPPPPQASPLPPPLPPPPPFSPPPKISVS